ncbi:MAG: Flp pilus assembly protein CpaB [Mycobacteriaceae bacterium]
MGRRTVLLVVAALIAALGTTMVFLYVRGADSRAEAAQTPIQVLKAVAQINPGETLAQAQAAGKIQLGTVPKSEVLTGAVNSTAGMDSEVALATIFPNEQIVTAKFGSPGDEQTLQMPNGDIAISVSLSDTGRVAGFVQPGGYVSIFASAPGSGANAKDGIRMLLPKVQVIAVGATTVISSTTTDGAGAQTTEQLPKTLFTLALNQADAQKVMYAASHGELTFGLLNNKSKVKAGPGVTADNLYR